MSKKINAFMLAGTNSNVGKTTVTIGILAALKKRGLSVMPYKTGPDYIDPMFHRFVTGNPSRNLDTWMLEDDVIKYLFTRNLTKNNIGLIEGVMGLYDGYGIQTEKGSSAYLSKVIGAPVILIINGRGMSGSAAALVKGFVEFDPEVNIAGVIINQLSSDKHYTLLKEIIEEHTGVKCLGYLPKNMDITLDSRHLGLIPVDELEGLEKNIDLLSNLVEKHIDLDQLVKLAAYEFPEPEIEDPFVDYYGSYKGMTVGIARDEAFNFYYDDNIEILKKLGVELVEFSPIWDHELPAVDALYIGGGFPEIFGKELEGNISFREDLKEKLIEGLPCYAECGGLMYLTKSITMLDGTTYETTGFFPADTKMTKRLQRFGYIEVVAEFPEKKVNIRGHEFHHTIINSEAELKHLYRVTKKDNSWQEGIVKNNVLAGYPHIHFYSNPEFLLSLLDKAIRK
jgi:cobyrinic acid a,c-diamide synthase